MTHYLHTKCQRPRKQCASELQTVNFFLHDYIDGYALYAVSSMFIITEDLQKDYWTLHNRQGDHSPESRQYEIPWRFAALDMLSVTHIMPY